MVELHTRMYEHRRVLNKLSIVHLQHQLAHELRFAHKTSLMMISSSRRTGEVPRQQVIPVDACLASQLLPYKTSHIVYGITCLSTPKLTFFPAY